MSTSVQEFEHSPNSPAGKHLLAAIIKIVRSDRIAFAYVLFTWLIMVTMALTGLVFYGKNVPLAEDWYLVPALTGHEPDLPQWLWSQNNEHRIPLPRLILLLALKISHGDFRAGMVLSVTTLGALALAMILVARSLRDGRTSYTDALFPVSLLHLGHWENLFWSWQFSFVLPTALTCVLLLILVRTQIPFNRKTAVIAGICLISLPLCGANGLAFVPFLSLWLGMCGVLSCRARDKTLGNQPWAGLILIGSALLALTLTGLYFVGYERPAWTPPNPGLLPSFKAALQFLALSFGPTARHHWAGFIIAALLITFAGAAICLIAGLSNRGVERLRAFGLLVFLSNMVVFALMVGWGRAAVIGIYGDWPLRYILLGVPALLAAYFIWDLYGSKAMRVFLQGGLFLGLILLIPSNSQDGFWWNYWYQKGMKEVEQDVAASASAFTIADRHGEFLIHFMETSDLAARIMMLERAGMTLFGQSPAALSDKALLEQEIQYQAAAAREIFLVWGVNGWNPLPDAGPGQPGQSGHEPSGTQHGAAVIYARTVSGPILAQARPDFPRTAALEGPDVPSPGLHACRGAF